jgi:hypothetical protein
MVRTPCLANAHRRESERTDLAWTVTAQISEQLGPLFFLLAISQESGKNFLPTLARGGRAVRFPRHTVRKKKSVDGVSVVESDCPAG